MIRRTGFVALAIVAVCAGFILCGPAFGADEKPDATDAKPAETGEKTDSTDVPVAKDPPGLVRLGKTTPVWIDPKRKLVLVDGKVVLREGQLEMFACPKQTKEHESIVSVDCKAHVVHAGLLAVGAKIGHPVKYDPKYVPAAGTEIEILILWTDKEGKRHKDRAQKWIRNVKTGKAMAHNWVFAGSGFWSDEQTGIRHYHADAGDMICVSNFSTAMLDLPISSSQSNEALLFDAFTKNIPPKGTKVRLVLVPKLKKKDGEKKAKSD